MSNKGFFEEVIAPKRPSKAGGELWLLTYSDLVTNLMAIFVLLFSMSSIDKAKFDTVSSEIQNRQTDNLQKLQKKIENTIIQNNLQSEMRTTLDFEGLRVIFQGSSMFESASSSLVPSSIERLTPVLNLVGKIDPVYQVSLEGHTDDVPISKGKRLMHADNWALSSARGVALLQVLANKGVMVSRMNVGGYADTRPVVSPIGLVGEKLAQARALNRRVVIRIFQ